jgi:cytochrome c biogenesis protein CcmG, thiol:disulfide interchange protein DsbE
MWRGARGGGFATLCPVRRRLLPLAAVIGLVVVVVIGLSQAEESSSPQTPERRTLNPAQVRARLAGAPAPLARLHRNANGFLPGEDEGLQRELKRLRGHPVVVNVWAAWCGPCRQELPVFQEVSVAQGKRVAFLGVDVRDNRPAAEKLLRDIPVSYPSVEDPDNRISQDLKLVGVPATIFYDAEGGEPTFVHQGPYLDRADLEADIRKYALGRG